MRVIDHSSSINTLLLIVVEKIAVYTYSFKFDLVMGWQKIQELWDQKIPEELVSALVAVIDTGQQHWVLASPMPGLP